MGQVIVRSRQHRDYPNSSHLSLALGTVPENGLVPGAIAPSKKIGWLYPGLARHLGAEPPDRGLGRIGFDERSTDEVSEDASLRLRRNDTIDDCGFFEQFLAR